MKVFGVTGWKNSGKTGLVERLVRELTTRGYVVSTIKHAHHSFDVDHPGRDSYRHREAGAQEVVLGSYNRWCIMHELRGGAEPTLDELLAKMSPVDIVIVEGYKSTRSSVSAARPATACCFPVTRGFWRWPPTRPCRRQTGRCSTCPTPPPSPISSLTGAG